MDSSVTALKTSRKRKKHQAGNASINTTKKKKFSSNSDPSSKSVQKKKSFANKIEKSEGSSFTDKKSNKSDKTMDVNMSKKLKKNVLKTRKVAGTKSQSLVQSKSSLKSKKNKKFKKVPSTNIQVSQSTSKPDVNISKTKKGKKKKAKPTPNLEENINSESDDEFICISDDNESDEETLREEIEKSSIFKQISKLMKKAPHLNPAYEVSDDLSDKEMDDYSDLSLSAESDNEDSAMEIDDQGSSESDLEDSNLKNESSEKKEKPVIKKQDQNVLAKKKNKSTEIVSEVIGFNRTSRVDALKRNIPDKGKKGEMSSNLKNKVQEKLAGAKFRFLNEKLYTETGKEAFKYFQENTEEFDDYHSGYRLQVSKWPINPVNEIIADIQKLKKSLVIADLGCGEAKVAQTFPDRTIHSFDLVPLNEFVKACDISKIPLPNETVDIAVFCLSLMGTNLKDYLCEAFRILKVGGILKIAEVESRIEDLGHFIKYLKSIGFTLIRKNTKHKLFVFLDLKKEKQKCKLQKVPSLSLRPCLYKKR